MSTRKRKRAQVVHQEEDFEEEAEQQEGDEGKENGEKEIDPAEKEQEVWDAIREERYEIVEQLPLTLHRQLSLMKQLDQQSQSYLTALLPTLRSYIQLRKSIAEKGEEHTGRANASTVDAMAADGTPSTSKDSNETLFSIGDAQGMAIPRERARAPETTREYLSHVAWLSEELLRASQEKVNLAQATTDSVERHIRLLDVAIQEQEASLISSTQGTISLPDLTLPKPTRQSGNVFDKYNSITLQTSGLLNSERIDDEGGDSPIEEIGIPRDILKAMFVSPTKNEAGEELYCYCNRASFGEMIACDGPQCGLEWFHLGCVGLKEPPEGEWFCENCTKFDM
ncbi:hypothetical protein CC1G_05200 [Coprinopsis cinerea okayama7|uniref:Chromatin modification-related protein n=1 Tax=Coprinopsis cinerea (strain Okayama-7 / 130 / ATCC MYA-4618 / FGSC 9003) TaxID=240176 RepID=A8NG76_COPC7|nr:hypothetical protein CC1G_05200 [Coprinopsis cinerea okayama7\|eukprot:XP_001833500.1 hypothetical protein CC1G_05200 [Coprinopsis cinerea okayama7\